MKKSAICYACDKRIRSDSEFRIGMVTHRWPVYRIFHKKCFEEFMKKGKYFDNIIKKWKPSQIFWKLLGKPQWMKIGSMSLVRFFYPTGIYELNNIKHWIIIVLFTGLFYFLLRNIYLSLFYFFKLWANTYLFYFLISIPTMYILYELFCLIYFYKKYVY